MLPHQTLTVFIVMPLAELRGGGEMALVQLLREGRDLGVAWTVLFLEDGPMIPMIEELGVPAIVVPAGKLRQVSRYAKTVLRIASILRRERPDVVLGWMGHAQLYGGLAGRLAGVPSMWYQIGNPSRKNLLDRIALLLGRLGVLTNSQQNYDKQKSIAPGKPVRLVYNGVDLARFDPASLPPPDEARRALGLPENGPIIGTVGRLQHWKGMHTLLRAMPTVLERYPDATCVIVGGEHKFEPEYPAFLQSLVRDLGLQERVVMAGLQENVPLWMQAMDIVAHTSDDEPFGIVVLEAMCLGKPVVAGASGGPMEIITSRQQGSFAAFEDHGGLAKAILRYLDDPDLAAQTGASARLRAQDFSERNYAVNLVAAVKALASA